MCKSWLRVQRDLLIEQTRDKSAQNKIQERKDGIIMAIFGVRETGAKQDVTTVQVQKSKSVKVMTNRAMRAVEELQEDNSSVLSAFKNYEVVLLWVE